MDVSFTSEEISVIDKNLGYIVFDWAKHLINHILSQARNNNVEIVYMNTSETLNSGDTQDQKVNYFYTKLPPMMGFEIEKANLRGNGKENLWAYHLNTVISESLISLIKCAGKNIPLEKLPQKYQGAFLSLIGKKPFYTQEDINSVLSVLEQKQKKQKKSTPKYYYDWNKEWSGSQRFNSAINEMVVFQKLPEESQKTIMENKTLLKFWSLLLSQNQHFGYDTIGFALVSKVSNKIWVINEIQTDAISAYLKLRNQYKTENKMENKKISWETLRDMLTANNRSKWIPILETNEAMKEQMLNDPRNIHQLPDDSQDIDKWIKEQMQQQTEMGATQDLDLMHHFQNTNFNTRIFRTY